MKPMTAVCAARLRLRRAQGWVRITAACLSVLAVCRTAEADPDDYVQDLDISAGQKEIAVIAGAATATPNGAPAQEATAVQYEVGITDHILSETYLQFANSTPGSSGGGVDGFTEEGVFRFTDPGEHWADFGAMIEVEHPRVWSQGWYLTLSPMLQTDIGPVQVNLDPMVTKIVGGPAYGSAVQLGFQYQFKFRTSGPLDYGIQGFGYGKSWAAQNIVFNRWNNVGPAVFGSIPLASGRSIDFDAGLLFGTTNDAPSRTVRAEVVYAFY
jgi:hypothetical protein